MVGIRSPVSLVVGSCTSHPGVLGSIPKQEEPGKTGARVGLCVSFREKILFISSIDMYNNDVGKKFMK